MKRNEAIVWVARHREQVLLYLYKYSILICVLRADQSYRFEITILATNRANTLTGFHVAGREYAIRDAERRPRFIKSARCRCAFSFFWFSFWPKMDGFFISLCCCWSLSLPRMRVYRSRINFDFRTKHLACFSFFFFRMHSNVVSRRIEVDWKYDIWFFRPSRSWLGRTTTTHAGHNLCALPIGNWQRWSLKLAQTIQ